MSIDPGLIRAESHMEVGFLIQRDTALLIERWSVRAIQEQPNAQRVHRKVLVDHFHEFLQALGRSLADSEDIATTQHCHLATIHGEDRWETGWSLPEVVRDYQILRLVILDYLDEILEQPAGHRAVMAIGLALDEAIAASVTKFVTSREEHLRQLEEERTLRDREIQEHLRQRAETLREVDRRKNEFMAVLGHEMRNPLAPLWHAARLLEFLETTDSTLVQSREIIKRQVQQLGRLADDLLDISRIAQAKVELRTEPVELAAIVDQAAQTSTPHLKARHHEFVVELATEPIWLQADPGRLVQIVVNLLNNAAKYTEPGGRVWLATGRDGDEAVIRVTDNGMGIPKAMLPHVFELFTQGEWSAEHAQGGMGIGLALVRRLVELHAGTIAVTSEGLGYGSEFVVRLPVLAAQPPSKSTVGPSGSGRPDSTVSRVARRRILVVDDNVDAAFMLRLLLSRDGHDICLAHDGLAALKAAEEFKPEVVLLDIGLPRMDGYQVAKRLRERPEMATTLLVALTGYGQDEDRQRSHSAGFNAHLVKPVDLDALHTALNQSASAAHPRSTI